MAEPLGVGEHVLHLVNGIFGGLASCKQPVLENFSPSPIHECDNDPDRGSASPYLSPWHLFRKGLWDFVRGLGNDATMQYEELRQMSELLLSCMLWRTPSMQIRVLNIPSPRSFNPYCGPGGLAASLFLLDTIVHQLTRGAVQAYLEGLLCQIMSFSWVALMQAGWPIFHLVYRVAVAKHLPQYFNFDGSVVTFNTVTSRSRTAKLVRDAQMAVIAFRPMGKNVFVPEAGPFWSQMSSWGETILLEGALEPPSSALRSVRGAAKYFLEHLKDEFRGGAGALPEFMRNLLRSAAASGRAPLHCWDVGAQFFSGSWQDEVWSICRANGADVRAFEPSESGHSRLRAELGAGAERLAISNFTGTARLNRAGRTTASLDSRGCGLWIPLAECADSIGWEDVSVTTVDTLLGNASLDILKVDVEGDEWNVVLGAEKALADSRIGLLVLEYGDKWSRSTALATKHYWKPAAAATAGLDGEPSLARVVKSLSSLGFSAYIIGLRTLVPIADSWWHDIYEMCQAPHSFFYSGAGRACWLDVAFVHANHRFAQLAEGMVHLHSLVNGTRHGLVQQV